MAARTIRPLALGTKHNDIKCADRPVRTTQCPLYKGEESKDQCSYRYCYDSTHNSSPTSMRCTRSKNSIQHSDRIYDTTCSQMVPGYSKEKIQENDKCISLQAISTTGVLYRNHSLGVLDQEQEDEEEEKPATLNIEEIKAKRSEISLGSCLLCNKLQRPQITQCSFNSLIFSAIIRLFPLLRPATRILGHKQIKLKQLELKSKAFMGLLFAVTRLLCVFEIARIPMSGAVESMISQEHPLIPSFLNDNISMTVMQASQQDFEGNPLVPKSQELDIISSSPAPIISSAFLIQEQIQMPSPTNSSHNISIVNRETIFKHINAQVNYAPSQQSSPAIEPTTTKGKSSAFSSSSACSTCQFYKAKNDSLESIKLHILSKLRLTESPKVEMPRQLPQNIIDEYYRKYDRNGRRRTFKSNFQTGKMNARSFDGQLRSWNSFDSYEDTMQSDDPNALHSEMPFEYYYDDIGDDDDNDNDDEGDSLVKSVYVFPTTPRMRHNKKSDVLSFRYENSDNTVIMRAILHLYIRGWDWMAVQEPDVAKQLKINGTEDKTRDIVIAVHRALRRPNASNYTHTVQMAEIRQRLPSGPGKWIQINLKELSRLWVERGESNQIVVIKTSEAWMRQFVVTGIGKSAENNYNVLTAHMEVRTARKPGRRRRSTSLDCQESDNEVRCCRYPLKVNFTSFGWSFVVAPTDFDAYFCNGECKLGYLEQYTHTHIASLSRSASPCCSPTKMSSLTLLHFNLDQNLVLSTIPNMTVEKCSCS